MRRAAIVAAIIGFASGACLPAQGSRRAPGAVVNGKIVVRVHVVLRDDETPYYPVVGLELRFFRSATDSVVAVTDGAGAATVLLSPGDYRLVSARDAVWKGDRYSWSIPLVVEAGMLPIDLREPASSSRSSTTGAVQEATPVSVPATVAPEALTRHPGSGVAATAREGFWISLGLGAGSLGCDDCSDRVTSLSGNLSLGATAGRQFLVGAFLNGWAKQQDDVTISVGTLTAGVRWYPEVTSGFFLTGGLGISTIEGTLGGAGAVSVSVSGSGAMLGLGWDIPIGRSVSVTPFLNGVGVSIDGFGANFSQFGIGITWH